MSSFGILQTKRDHQEHILMCKVNPTINEYPNKKIQIAFYKIPHLICIKVTYMGILDLNLYYFYFFYQQTIFRCKK